MRRSLAVATACLSLALVACSPAAKKKPTAAITEQQATADVCSKLAKVGSALEASAALKPSSTVGEAETVGENLQMALDALNQAEVTLEQTRFKAFQEKAQAFNTQLKQVAKDKQLTLEAAAETLKPQAESVVAAHQELKAAVQCDGAAAAPAN